MYNTGRSQDPASTKQYTKTIQKGSRIKLLLFSQCKYSLANAKSSLETKQKEGHSGSVLQIILAPGGIPCTRIFDF